MKQIALNRIRKTLENMIGNDNVSDKFYKVSESCLNEVSRKVFGMNKTAPHVVARPTKLDHVQAILRYANKNRIPIFVRGGGTGYFGGDIPTKVGVVIEMTGLSRVTEFDKEGGHVSCEAGITVSALNQFLRKHRYWWPHNPGSRVWATVGGSISTLGVGVFTTRFGYASDSVLSMTVVTPTGEIVKLGTKVRHDLSSYNLLDLFASAEGTLGIIVEVTLKVFPLPRTRNVTVFFFKRIEGAVKTCYDIVRAGIYPELLIIEDKVRFTLEGLASLVDLKSLRVEKLGLGNVEAILLVSCSGLQEVIEFECRQITKIAVDNGGRTMEDRKMVDIFWKSKTEISSWSKGIGESKVHTFVPAIPLNRAGLFHRVYSRLLAKYPKLSGVGVGYYVVLPNFECTASARMMFDDMDPEAISEYEAFTRQFASEVVKMEGTPASTFGVGMILVDVAEKLAPPAQVQFMRQLKRAIDIKGVLSPGKKYLNQPFLKRTTSY